MEKKSSVAVYAALAANMAVAVVKFVAAAVTGSSSMLSEGIHSTVDSSNEILLLIGIHKSKKPADDMHPFGHGQEIYFYSLIVSVLIFGLGGGMSVYEGIMHIKHPVVAEDTRWGYIVLALSFVFEGISLAIPLKSFFKKHPTSHFWRQLRRSKDPSFFVIIFENGAALIGLVLAFLGLFFSSQFHLPVIDGIASILIGVLLAIVAIILIIESRNLLIGESANKEKINSIYAIVNSDEDVVKLRKPLTMQLAPEEVLLALDVEFGDHLDGNQLAKAIKRLECAIQKKFPDVKQIFIEATNITDKVIE